MKKIIVALVLLVGINGFAQETKQQPKKAESEKLTSDQRNQLHLKRLTLELDLNAAQQNEMRILITEQSAKKESQMAENRTLKAANKKLTSDEMFAKKSKMLDDEIAMKEKVKKILNPEQMKKWEIRKEHEHKKAKKEMLHKKKKATQLEKE